MQTLSDDPSCASCDAIYVSDPADDDGQCRRLPPTVLQDEEGVYSAFPLVPLRWFCRAFSRKVH